jgi:hypothetical protein
MLSDLSLLPVLARARLLASRPGGGQQADRGGYELSASSKPVPPPNYSHFTLFSFHLSLLYIFHIYFTDSARRLQKLVMNG